ncbi:MAG: hypothetical protein Mars2KO_44480 [Maribacter sp.]
MEEIKVDKDYKEAFNQGYELSKELGLKPNILNDLASGNNRMQAMKDGMVQYEKEIQMDKSKGIIPPLDLDNIGKDYIDLSPEKEDKDKGKDIDI